MDGKTVIVISSPGWSVRLVQPFRLNPAAAPRRVENRGAHALSPKRLALSSDFQFVGLILGLRLDQAKRLKFERERSLLGVEGR